MADEEKMKGALGVRLPHPMLVALRKRAKAMDRSVGYIVRDLIQKFLSKPARNNED